MQTLRCFKSVLKFTEAVLRPAGSQGPALPTPSERAVIQLVASLISFYLGKGLYRQGAEVPTCQVPHSFKVSPELLARCGFMLRGKKNKRSGAPRSAAVKREWAYTHGPVAALLLPDALGRLVYVRILS